jgi:uncharacterized protein
MEIGELISELAKPGAFPCAAQEIEVRHTHISVVFLTDEFAYKIKKPVQLPFLDFSTLEQRRHFCEQEVALNRRLAPEVYLGVVPICRDQECARFEAAGEPIEWAVKMRRLPDAATLEQRLERDEAGADLIERVARRLAEFHAAAERNSHISELGRFETVARNVRENLEASASGVGTALSATVRRRLVERTENALAALQPLIDARAERGVPCDTHGDLHLDHVYCFPDRSPPDDLVIVDCIEFNERFRYADPLTDAAFLAMDLQFHGRFDLARSFVDAYLAVADDAAEAKRLLPFYLSYRAAIRGKVDVIQHAEVEIPQTERDAALVRARGHWLLALGEIENPSRRPCLVLVGGLPGTGKSTVSRGLAVRGGFTVIRTDVVRKELAPASEEVAATAEYKSKIYSPEWTDQTYAECLRRAEKELFEGNRVVVDATFVEESRRREFLDAAVRWGVPALFVVCETAAESVRQRLANRRNDASDADWSVYEAMTARWEAPDAKTLRRMRPLSTDGKPMLVIEGAAKLLRADGLLE